MVICSNFSSIFLNLFWNCNVYSCCYTCWMLEFFRLPSFGVSNRSFGISSCEPLDLLFDLRQVILSVYVQHLVYLQLKPLRFLWVPAGGFRLHQFGCARVRKTVIELLPKHTIVVFFLCLHTSYEHIKVLFLFRTIVGFLISLLV